MQVAAFIVKDAKSVRSSSGVISELGNICGHISMQKCFFMLVHTGDFCQGDFDGLCLREREKS